MGSTSGTILPGQTAPGCSRRKDGPLTWGANSFAGSARPKVSDQEMADLQLEERHVSWRRQLQSPARKLTQFFPDDPSLGTPQAASSVGFAAAGRLGPPGVRYAVAPGTAERTVVQFRSREPGVWLLAGRIHAHGVPGLKRSFTSVTILVICERTPNLSSRPAGPGCYA